MKIKFLYIISIALLAISCGTSPKFIEEDKLREIITQAIITDAILLEKGAVSSTDTMDYYSTILNRSGYTLGDLEYTISKMAARKSNPLNNLFDDINKRVIERANKANYRYRQMERLDTLAINHSTDTLLKLDTMIRGVVKDFTLKIPAQSIGKYTIIFDYQSHNSYDTPARQVISQFTYDSCKTPSYDQQRTLWINRAFQPRVFNQTLEHKDTTNNVLELKFTEQKADKKNILKDTSYIKNIRVYYQPYKEDARAIYLRDKTGLDKNLKFDINYAKEFIKPKTDSLTASPAAER